MSRMQALDPLQVGCQGVRLIEASAGTGKTYTIAALYLRLLLERQCSVRDILVVTFTEAATEELRGRIRERMRQALLALHDGTADPLLGALVARLPDLDAAREWLTNELTRIDEAAIFTIHGFCQRMLQENAFESGADFDAEFLTDTSELLGEVIRDFWRREFYPSPGLARLAETNWRTPEGLRDVVRPYLARRELVLHPPIDPAQCDEAAYRAALASVRTLWLDHGADIEALLAGFAGLRRDQRDGYPLTRVAALGEEMRAFLAGPEEDFAVPAGLVWFTPERLAKALKKAAVAAGPPQHAFFEAAAVLLAIVELKRLELLGKAIAFARSELARRKQQRGLIAFDDLLTRLADALSGEGGPALAARIAGQYPYALIDEFQDTDPEQYRIFSTVYRDRPECGLFMIGDPKQAIYSFRGADVFTYMRAKDATDPATERFTLDTNWRSAGTLVEAVNTLFGSCPAPFVYAGHIDFQPVAASGKADAAPLLIDGVPPVPLRAWFVPRTADNIDRPGQTPNLRKPITKGWADRALSVACAEQIVQLLSRAQSGAVTLDGQPLAPRDIAVLVRDRYEAAQVQVALRERGVASVFYSRDSVFAAPEAEALLQLLSAVAEPDAEGPLRTALCSPLLGLDAAGLDALLQDELAWEQIHEEFHDYHRLWQQYGFMVMFRQLLHARGIPARLLAEEGGERTLTNLLQLAELTQSASREHDAVENLLHWFAEQKASPDGDSEDQQLRLESEADLVKIVTIHKSKGLEYPVVFLPFLWTAKPRPAAPVLFHREDAGRQPVLDLAGEPEHWALAEKERLAEDLRLAYVALTRARHLCWFAWGRFKEAEHSALAWLLHAPHHVEPAELDPAAVAETVGALDDAALRARLEALARQAPQCIAVETLPTPGEDVYQPVAVEAAPLAARSAPRRVRQDWHIASFSGLTQGRLEATERPDYGSAREDAAQRARGERSIFLFPRGARAGTFMHHLFESLDFPRAEGEPLRAAVAAQLARHGYEADWQPVIEAMVGDVLDARLDSGPGEAGADGGGALTLRGIAREQRLIEMEFHYPIARLSGDTLEAALPGLGGGIAAPRLRFAPVTGVMRGFIDLVFEHAGRFYLLDYKSSWLGTHVEDYAPAALRAAVAANRYDLQYLIYSVALHRYLRHRIPDYSYARHFGGVYYLFLRGMRAGDAPRHGVYFDRPEAALIARLDALFAGEEVAA